MRHPHFFKIEQNKRSIHEEKSNGGEEENKEKSTKEKMAASVAAAAALFSQRAGSVSQAGAAAAAAMQYAAEVYTSDEIVDAQASSEVVNSTLMGIALLAYLRGSAMREVGAGAHDFSSANASAPANANARAPAPASANANANVRAPAPANVNANAPAAASTFAPKTSKGAIRAPLHRPSSRAEAYPLPLERVPRRYQMMSPKDIDVPAEPLVRTLSAIRATQSQAQYTCTRKLTSSTYLQRVHVNAAMSQNLFPDYESDRTCGETSRDAKDIRRRRGGGDDFGGCDDISDGTLATTSTPVCYKPNGVIFRKRVRMLDEREREWTITYESLCSSGQRHTRFSAGWAAMCKANGFKVGETIVFSLWGGRDDGVVVVGRAGAV